MLTVVLRCPTSAKCQSVEKKVRRASARCDYTLPNSRQRVPHGDATGADVAFIWRQSRGKYEPEVIRQPMAFSRCALAFAGAAVNDAC